MKRTFRIGKWEWLRLHGAATPNVKRRLEEQTPGRTLWVCFGTYAGFFLSIGDCLVQLCLGRVSVAWFRGDVEKLLFDIAPKATAGKVDLL